MYIYKSLLELPPSSAKIAVTETNVYLQQSLSRHQPWLDTYAVLPLRPGVSGGAARGAGCIPLAAMICTPEAGVGPFLPWLPGATASALAAELRGRQWAVWTCSAMSHFSHVWATHGSKDSSTVTNGRSARALLPARGTTLFESIPARPLAQRSIRAVLGTALYLRVPCLCVPESLCVCPYPSVCPWPQRRAAAHTNTSSGTTRAVQGSVHVQMARIDQSWQNHLFKGDFRLHFLF